VLRETRAGIVLFLVSVFSVLLNPVILSGAASGYNTGMPPTDVALATAISSGAGTLVMSLIGNYPW
jgi:AGZA family xanthine/uracil permease-like MFS transporter